MNAFSGRKRGDPILENRQLLTRFVLALLLIAGYALFIVCKAEAQSQSQSITVSGSAGAITVSNPNNYTAASFEEIPITGSPASASITVQGCNRGGTCDSAADTNTGLTAAIRGISFTKVYDYFKITATWSGGTASGYTINSHVGFLPAGGASSSNATIISPVDGSGYVEVNCKTGCSGANPNGQATMANSSPVVIASNQSAVAISGPNTNGSALSANSAPVVIASDQAAVAQNLTQVGGANVSTGTGAGGAGIPRVTISNDSSLAANQSVNVNQIAGTSPTVKAASTSSVAADTSLVVQISPNQPAFTTPQNVGQSGTWNVRAQDGSGNALTSNSATQSRSLDFNLVSVLGATNSATNGLFARLTDNTNAITADFSAYGTAPTGTEAPGVNAYVTNAVNVYPSPNSLAAQALSASSQSSLTTAVVVKAAAGNLYGFSVTNGAATTCYIQFINVSSSPSLGTTSTYSFAVPGTGTLTVGPNAIGLSHYTSGISVGMSTAYNGSSACGTAATAVIFYD
jgi:hypothetical protein